MTTYDYYKNQVTHELYYNQKMFVEDGKVLVESTSGTPRVCQKGVWSVENIIGGTQFVPEGDPNYDENAEQIVWGKSIASREACETSEEDYYDEGGYPKFPYTRKLIEQSKAYWANK